MSLVTRPKRFLASLKPEDAINRAIFFFLVSVSVALVFELSFISKAVDAPFLVAKTVVSHLLAAIALALFTFFGFSIVGGKASPLHHLMVVFYISGVYFLFYAPLAAAAKGIVLHETPQLYPLFIEFMNSMALPIRRDATRFAPLFEGESNVMLCALLFVIALVLFSIAWIIACWGALRQISGVSRSRSIVAFVLVQLFGLVLGFVLNATMAGLGIVLF